MSDLPTGNDQADLFPLEQSKLFEQATSVVLELLKSGQPSAWDLLQTIEEKVGWKARCLVKDVLEALLGSTPALPRAVREYLQSLRTSSDLDAALRGTDAPKKEVASTVDMLLRRSKVYSDSGQFREMISFMARFRDYAPYNTTTCSCIFRIRLVASLQRRMIGNIASRAASRKTPAPC